MISISEHFNYKKLLKYVFPSIIMMIFTSIYSVVDGLFVSNFAGKEAFASVNFIFPILMILGGFGFMFGSGGSALIAKTLGENKKQRANEIFSGLVLLSFLSGILLALIGYFSLPFIAKKMGATDGLLESSLLYGNIYLIGIPALVITYEFQTLFVTANKPKIGLLATIISGVLNIILDAIFVASLKRGVEGAALATIISQYVCALIPLIYFSKKNKSNLNLVRPKINFKDQLKIVTNGSSELVNNISVSLVSVIFNIQLLKYAGENGLAAYGVLMYINFLFMAIFIGYTVGVSPLISYNYGAKNHEEIHSLLVKSLVILGSASLLMTALSLSLAIPASKLFVGYDDALYKMTLRAFFIFSFSFLFSGFALFSSSFFTTLNNGLISAILSFMHTLVFQIALVMLLPLLLDVDGIWLAVPIAELLATILGFSFIFIYKKKYNY